MTEPFVVTGCFFGLAALAWFFGPLDWVDLAVGGLVSLGWAFLVAAWCRRRRA